MVELTFSEAIDINRINASKGKFVNYLFVH